MIVVVDTREQLPWKFPDDVDYVLRALPAGDYSLDGYESQIAIERKSLPDLFGTVGKGRQRFERELERLQTFEYAAILIEASWYDIIRQPPRRSGMKPKAVVASLIAWEQRYNVHVHACCNRQLAQRIAYRILDRFWRDKNSER